MAVLQLEIYSRGQNFVFNRVTIWVRKKLDLVAKWINYFCRFCQKGFNCFWIIFQFMFSNCGEFYFLNRASISLIKLFYQLIFACFTPFILSGSNVFGFFSFLSKFRIALQCLNMLLGDNLCRVLRWCCKLETNRGSYWDHVNQNKMLLRQKLSKQFVFSRQFLLNSRDIVFEQAYCPPTGNSHHKLKLDFRKTSALHVILKNTSLVFTYHWITKVPILFPFVLQNIHRWVLKLGSYCLIVLKLYRYHS